MKISIALSILILAAAAAVGWRDDKHLVAVRHIHSELVVQAANLGFSIDPKNPAGPVRVTKHERENRDAAAKLTAAEFIAFAKEMEAMEGQPSDATQKRVLDFIDKMMSMDPAQLKIIIAEVRASKDLKDETRQQLISFSIMTLINDHPQAALAIFTESSDILKDGQMGGAVISSALAKWAKEDPMAALDWVRKNSEKFPDLVTEDAKRGLISGAAASDPKLAFQLIGELGLKDSSSSIDAIIRAAKTPEDRTATLSALRDHLAGMKDEDARVEVQRNAVGELARSVANDGFEVGSKWLENADLTPAELTGFASGFNYNSIDKDIGQWIGWIGEKIPAEKSAGSIANLVSIWTRNDYEAAGKWLGSTADGPVKNASIRAYTEAVAKYEPETAVQWALTLPAGKDRDGALLNIYRNWPKDDPAAQAAAEAFAKANGIK